MFLVAAGILLGTVFTVGMYYWTRPIEKTEAIRVDATFASYQKHYRRHNLNSLTLYFSDHEPLSIDNVCFTSDVLNHIENMAPGTVLELYVHPNSDTILEMVCGGKVILDFNQESGKTAADNQESILPDTRHLHVHVGCIWCC